jgi:pyrroloquinoline quinone (PQQ) biosynthesis protein C
MKLNDTMRSLEQRVEEGALAIRTHALSQKAAAGKWSAAQRLAYSVVQYGFAVVWPGFLGAVGDRVNTPELKQAFKENALCEVGATGTGHVFLARKFAISQGITPAQLDKWCESDLSHQSMSRMFALVDTEADEGYIAGYLYAQETLAGVMFESFLPAFKEVAGCAIEYMTVHIEVDGDEHGPMIMKGIEKLIALEPLHPDSLAPKCISKILSGIDDAIIVRKDYMEYIAST